MATFGEALEALEEFRSNLVNEQMNAPITGAQAMAFGASAGMVSDSPFQNVHATGVGIRNNKESAGSSDFVIKVYVFDREMAATSAAAPLRAQAAQGVEVDVEYLPIQFAFAKKKAAKKAKPPAAPARPAAANPAQHQRRIRPAPAGVEIGPLGGNFVGTLGCYVRRGAGTTGPLFILSNNHVLSDVNRFAIGTKFTQPFSANPADVIAALSDFEPIRFPGPGSQPRNVIDAAIASVPDARLVVLNRMLNIANYTPQLMAPRPGMAVTKAGRTTGVTTGTIRAIRVRGVLVNYGTRQNPLIATFDNAITITGAGGAAFSNPGDSGSAILDKASGRPVALLFAGDGATTTACDISAACARFGVRPV
jgi:hypothetical protein